VNDPKGKTIAQKVFVDAAKRGVEQGKDPETALRDAAAETGFKGTPNAPVVRQDLGLDSEESKATFGSIAMSRFLEANQGIFPQWILDVPDIAARAKLMLDYLKTFKGTLETALVTKTEKQVIEDPRFAGRSAEDIVFWMTHDCRWPKKWS
jgi:hypothetical protein